MYSVCVHVVVGYHVGLVLNKLGHGREALQVRDSDLKPSPRSLSRTSALPTMP